MSRRGLRWQLAFLGLALCGSAAAEGTPPLRIETVAEGVFAALQPTEKRFDDANTGFVIRARDVVVIDAPADAAAVQWLIGEIRRRTDKPVRYVINSHWHGDHTLGNQHYRAAFPAVEFIAHASVADDFAQRTLPQLEQEIADYDTAITAAEQRLADGVDREGQPLGERRGQLEAQIADARQALADKRAVVPTPPTLTFETALTLGAGAQRIELRHHVAHTRGDLVVYLPGPKVLFTGDLLDDLPFAGHGELASWIATLDALAKLEVAATVPGHGPVFADDRQRRKVRALLADALAAAAQAVAAGEGVEGVQRRLDVARHRAAFVPADDPVAARSFDGFLDALLERALEQSTETE